MELAATATAAQAKIKLAAAEIVAQVAAGNAKDAANRAHELEPLDTTAVIFVE